MKLIGLPAATLPAPVVRALLAPLAMIGRMRGHAERYGVPATQVRPQPVAATA